MFIQLATDPTFWADNESQLKEDEQIARALQESLNIESPPPIGNRNGNVSGNVIGNGNGNGNFYQPIPFPYSTSFRYKSLLCRL